MALILLIEYKLQKTTQKNYYDYNSVILIYLTGFWTKIQWP